MTQNLTPTWEETIKSILRQVFLEGLADGGTGGAMDDVVAENLVAINKAVLELVAEARGEMLEKLPEKRSELPGNDNPMWQRATGFNEAIDLMRKELE